MSKRKPYSEIEYQKAVRAELRSFERTVQQAGGLETEFPDWVIDLVVDRHDSNLRTLSLRRLTVTQDTRESPERESDEMKALPAGQRKNLARLYRAAVAYNKALEACVAATGIDGELAKVRVKKAK